YSSWYINPPEEGIATVDLRNRHFYNVSYIPMIMKFLVLSQYLLVYGRERKRNYISILMIRRWIVCAVLRLS
ncbi:MAG TPA: hypothetical protein PLF20_08440, partial [Bacteroidales bacterium]|nr:hypothetical protein [Bacteroidales bacterium]